MPILIPFLLHCLRRGHKWGAIQTMGSARPIQICDVCIASRWLVSLDWCLVDGSSGCVETCYLDKGWVPIYSVYPETAEPSADERAAAAKDGASILAYGGDGYWFAMTHPVLPLARAGW